MNLGNNVREEEIVRECLCEIIYFPFVDSETVLEGRTLGDLQVKSSLIFFNCKNFCNIENVVESFQVELRFDKNLHNSNNINFPWAHWICLELRNSMSPNTLFSKFSIHLRHLFSRPSTICVCDVIYEMKP